MEKMEKATDGRVKFERLPGGTVLTAPSTLRGVRDRVVDASYAIVQFHATDMPIGSLFGELTGIGTDAYATIAAVNEIYFVTCPECRRDFERNGVRALFMLSATPLTMACTKKADTANALKGTRLSVYGGPEMRWGAALGMIPRRQTFAEFVQSLQLGQTDCVTAIVAWIKSYGLTDTIKSVVEMPQGVVTGAVPLLFNAAAWDKISAADKKTLARNMARWVYEFLHSGYVEEDIAVKKELEGKVSFSPGDPAMAKKWEEYRETEIAALIKLAESRKIPDAAKIVRSMAAVFKKWHTEHLPKFKGNPEAFIDILDREVFAKVTY